MTRSIIAILYWVLGIGYLVLFKKTIAKNRRKFRQTSVQEFQEVVATIFNADMVNFSELFLSEEQVDQYMDVFEQILYLSQMYNLRNIKTGKVTFRSSKNGVYGSVDSHTNVDQNITTINFGDRPQKAFSSEDFSRRLRIRDMNKIIVTHEFAHVLTVSLRNTNEALSVEYWGKLHEIWKLYKEQKDQLIKDNRHISNYSFENIDEFHAEAFTEYHLSDRPSQIATDVGRLFDEYFKKETLSCDTLLIDRPLHKVIDME